MNMTEKLTPVECHTLGYLIEETKHTITVALTWCQGIGSDVGMKMAGTVVIPKKMVKRRVTG